MTGPLHGFRIVEMGGIGPAPFAGGLLGDLGADVVRIDRIPRPGAEPETPPRFDFYNRNKRSVALDLKQPAAVAAVLKLVAERRCADRGFPSRRDGAARPRARGLPCDQSAPRVRPHDRLGTTGPDRAGGRPRHQLSRADRRAAQHGRRRTGRRRRRSIWWRTSAAARSIWPSACWRPRSRRAIRERARLSTSRCWMA